MSKSVSLSIPTPCHEKWNNFVPTSKGGFCANCQKEVIDFTSWSEDELKVYFKKERENTCGKFMPAQLKTYSLRPDNNKSIHWLPMSALSLLLFLPSRESKAQEVKSPQHETMMLGKVMNDQPKPNTIIKKITGTVYDYTGFTTMSGVVITLKGSAQKTTTDTNGRFEFSIINPMPDDTLQFSFIGYEITERSISGKNELNINLKPDLMVMSQSMTGLMGTMGGIVVRRFPRNIWWRIKNVFR
ncbi:MAG TPA: carboxypeptidase-like regulatory domain-containing protein [Cyclobacteriaceae bacterium]|jgi:hypothetical protein|nr:carboxypeptidase-like regulatory domain-containing protein [Cyclobacteriaceae bacterium]